MPGRDMIVVGGSAGAIEALGDLLADAGFEQHVTKPVPLESLLQMVEAPRA